MKKNIKKQLLIILTAFFMPALAYAQVGSFQGLLNAIGSLISLLIPIVVALALLFFFWGLAKFIKNSGNEEKIKEGKRIMVWGIAALFVMTSIWGIVSLLQKDVLGIYPIDSFDLPEGFNDFGKQNFPTYDSGTNTNTNTSSNTGTNTNTGNNTNTGANTSSNTNTSTNTNTGNNTGSNAGTNTNTNTSSNTNSGSSTPAPDLVAGPATSPTLARAGVPLNFSSTISNSGNVSTGTGFSNFFQVASAPQGGGTITNLPPTTMSALNSGQNSTANSSSYTFPSAGVYSVRACADKSGATNSGSIIESFGNNNCGPWTDISVLSTSSTGTNTGTNTGSGSSNSNLPAGFNPGTRNSVTGQLPPLLRKLPDMSFAPGTVAYPPGEGPPLVTVDPVVSGSPDGLGFEYTGPGYPRIYEVGTAVRKIEFNANQSVLAVARYLPQLGGSGRPDVYPGVVIDASQDLIVFYFYPGLVVQRSLSRTNNLNSSDSNGIFSASIIDSVMNSSQVRPKERAPYIYFSGGAGFSGNPPKQGIPGTNPDRKDYIYGGGPGQGPYANGTPTNPYRAWKDPSSPYYGYPVAYQDPGGANINGVALWIIEQNGERWTYLP